MIGGVGRVLFDGGIPLRPLRIPLVVLLSIHRDLASAAAIAFSRRVDGPLLFLRRTRYAFPAIHVFSRVS